EVERLFGLLGDGKIDNHQNWKGRFKDNSDKMRSGSIYDVADVLKNLTFLAKSKSLSFREKRMLDRAKFLIISEVSEVMRLTAVDIEARVDTALERCFSNRARTAARAKVAKVAPRAAATAAPRRAARASSPSSNLELRTEKSELRRPRRPPAEAGVFIYDSGHVLIAAVRSLLAYVAVSLFVLVTAPIGMLLALTFGWTDLLYVFGHAGAQMA